MLGINWWSLHIKNEIHESSQIFYPKSNFHLTTQPAACPSQSNALPPRYLFSQPPVLISEDEKNVSRSLRTNKGFQYDGIKMYSAEPNFFHHVQNYREIQNVQNLKFSKMYKMYKKTCTSPPPPLSVALQATFWWTSGGYPRSL